MVDVLDIRKLRMLAELERLGTIAAVAHNLHLTAPGISMQLAALEREVGVPLTERNGRRLTLTPAGALLARHGHDIVDQLTLAEMEVNALREGKAGTYRVAAFPSIARTIVATTWAQLAREGGALCLELTEMEPQNSLPALSAGEVDLALIHSYSNMSSALPAGLISAPLMTENVWLAVPRSHGTPNPVDLSAYAGHDWMVPHRRLACYEMVQRACGLAGFSPRIVAECTDFSVQLALVAAGAGVALVPELTIANLPDNVALVQLQAPVKRHDFVVTRQTGEVDAGSRTLRELFVTTARNYAPISHGRL